MNGNIQLFATLGASLVSIIAIIIAFIFNVKLLKQKKYEEERKLINEILTNLYGPIKQYLNKSRELYIRFTLNKPENFRTITALANGVVFAGNDKVLLEEIINIGIKVEDIIIAKAGLIDDNELREDYFPKFVSHTTLLRLLYKGVIIGEPERFKDDLFPRGIEDQLEKRIKELYKRIEELNRLA